MEVVSAVFVPKQEPDLSIHHSPVHQHSIMMMARYTNSAYSPTTHICVHMHE